MRHSASVPHNFHSAVHAQRRPAACTEPSGFVVLRAARGASKAMRVQFVAAAGALIIRLVQDADGQRHAFDLCRLDYRTLAAGWFWDDPAAFVLAAAHDGRLYHEIYCYPADASRNAWLRVFEAKRVMSTPLFDNDRRLARPSAASRLVMPAVRESREAATGSGTCEE